MFYYIVVFHWLIGLRRDVSKTENVGDVFMGYHTDAAPAVVVKVWHRMNLNNNNNKTPLKQVKKLLGIEFQ